MRIGFLSTDWSDVRRNNRPTPGGANWYRTHMPAAALLAETDHQVVIGNAMESMELSGELVLYDWDKNRADGIDVLVLQRWMGDKAAESIEKAKALGQVVLNDVDDWWFGMRPSNNAFYNVHPKYSPESNTNHYRALCASSNALICSTPFLAHRMPQQCGGVAAVVIRNRIDVDRYEKSDVSGDPMVGWVGAVAHRSSDLQVLNGIIQQWLRRNPKAGFFHGGADSVAASARTALNLPLSTPGKTMPMQTIYNYPKLFKNRFNVGIVPLSSAPFNEAKSCLKGLEYAAAGIPFIASATPEYVWLRDTYDIGIIASKPKQWLAALDRLSDENERVMLGARYRQSVQALSPVGLGIEWESAFETLGWQRPVTLSA